MHCCMKVSKYSSDNQEHKVCEEISKVAYENLKDYIKQTEMGGREYDVSIDINFYIIMNNYSKFIRYIQNS